jgi:hypothetical protein
VRGLAPGAPVELRGIKVGEVVDIRAQVDVKTLKFTVPVIIELDAQRLGVKVLDLRPGQISPGVRSHESFGYYSDISKSQLRS